MKSQWMKRMIDIVGSLLLITIFLPIIICIYILILCEMGYPVFFTQMRPGLLGKPFFMYKFRTMLNKTDNNGDLLPDGERLTKLGIFLRKYSLDEIPELYNVLKSEMSLVGPRPLLMEYLPHYSIEQSHRHDVKPGITGWAQVNGRNLLDWKEKFKLDLWYVENWNNILDMKILFLTTWRIINPQGISHPGYETMPKFTGDN